MRKFLLAFVFALLGPGIATAAVIGEEVSYQAGDVTLKGYLAWDDSLGISKRPGVLVVHEWWGHNDYARKRARMLAELGYTALAVDMYGDGEKADHPDDAKKFMMAVKSNMPLATERFEAARSLLAKHGTVRSDDIAAIGYCFGGGIVLEMARRGADLKAVASFHGSLVASEPAKPGAIKAQILVSNGAADPFVKEEHKAAFKAEMEAAGASYTFLDHQGAQHSFTNPAADAFGKKFNMPLAYDAKADAESWDAMKKLLKLVFAH